MVWSRPAGEATRWAAVLSLMAAGVVASAAAWYLSVMSALGAASSSWTAQPAVLCCLGLLAVVGGVLYRRWDAAHATGEPVR